MKLKVLGAILVGAAALAVGAQASANPILITAAFDTGPPPPNDCPNTFGGNFDSCLVNGSPSIAKIGWEDGEFFVDDTNSTAFPSITGLEFTVEFDAGTDAAGTWSYEQGPGDPDVRYWSAKGGPLGFNLFWYIDEANQADCLNGTYTTACLDHALVVTSGTWSVPGGHELSHITFYDTARPVPAPGVMGLLGFGPVALALARRRYF